MKSHNSLSHIIEQRISLDEEIREAEVKIYNLKRMKKELQNNCLHPSGLRQGDSFVMFCADCGYNSKP